MLLHSSSSSSGTVVCRLSLQSSPALTVQPELSRATISADEMSRSRSLRSLLSLHV